MKECFESTENLSEIYIYKDTGRPNCGLMSLTASMLGKNLILGGDVNSLVKATVTYNFPPIF